MNDPDAKENSDELKLEYKLDASPDKVWRAICIPEYRESWFPDGELADVNADSSGSDQEISYTLREDTPPYLESTVTFQIVPETNGGTVLRIFHRLTETSQPAQAPQSANINAPLMMRAA